MNRVRIVIGGAALALAVTAPAAAQYGGGGGGGGTTSTTVASGAELGELVAESTPERVDAGDPVTVTTGGLTPGATGEVAFIRARQGADGPVVGSATVDANGNLSVTITTPNVQPGIYFVVIELDSGERVLAVVIVTGPNTAAQQASDDGAAASTAEPVAVPAEVQALQVSGEKEAELLGAVRDGGTIQLADGQLVAVPAPEVSAEESSTPLVAGFTAAGLVAAGLASRRIRRTRTA